MSDCDINLLNLKLQTELRTRIEHDFLRSQVWCRWSTEVHRRLMHRLTDSEWQAAFKLSRMVRRWNKNRRHQLIFQCHGDDDSCHNSDVIGGDES
jgi:hypothetical protein